MSLAGPQLVEVYTTAATVIPLARFYKIEGHMVTLLHHIYSWMHNYIMEAEDHIEYRVAKKKE